MSNRCLLHPQNCPTGIPEDIRSLFLIIFFCLLADVADIVFQYSAWRSIRCPQGILAEISCNGGHLGYGYAKNNGTDQLRCNGAADQRFCFHYPDSTIPQNFKLLTIFCCCTALSLCRTWSDTSKTGFVKMWLI